MVKIAVVIYSTYGHILTMSKAEVEGAKASGAEVDIFQLPSAEQNDASASSGLPAITPSKLAEYDGVIFGIPSRFGTHPYSFKAFLDATGAQWATGAYHGKFVGFFTTSGTQGGGQESVIRNSITATVHHGFIYVPLGYARAFGEITNLDEIHGGSPWGAGSYAGPTGTRQPSKIELDIARIQGKSFAETVAKALGKSSGGAAASRTAGYSSNDQSATKSDNYNSGTTTTSTAPPSTGNANYANNSSATNKAATSAPQKTEESRPTAGRTTSTPREDKSGCCKCM